MSVMSDINKLNINEPLIYLFSIDLTSLTLDGSNTVLYLASQIDNDNNYLSYNGIIYQPAPIKIQGVEQNITGSQNRPTLYLSNVVNSDYNLLLSSFNNFINAKVKIYLILYSYLDGKSQGGLNSYLKKYNFIINKKTAHNKNSLQFELKSVLDFDNLYLPRGQATRKCQNTYRTYNPTTLDFNYEKATCPYRGGLIFDEFGNTVNNKSQDICGKRFIDCKKRFPVGNIPINALPLITSYT